MIIFPILSLLSIVLYIYYKVMIVRTPDALTKEYLNSKSKICLGAFVFLWGINQYMFYETQLSLFIGIVLLILGGYQARFGWKAAKHYRNEYQKLQSTT
ncbi:hypothetical protein EQV77_00355 [Halobacillus fulvus]|nr:hypothetical protein EQV77_00355 [Halobacillus fulvus]